jgi:cobyrinic acid a,c-diamide synthase
MTLIIAGDRSGVGKTTITLAMLSFLARSGSKVQSFKVGPDYIDPMFHSWVTGRPCRNLDPILTSEAYVRSCFATHCQEVDYALVEGVMGLFDGVSWETNEGQTKDYASTAHIARLLNLPVILVIDCSRLSGSIAAIVHGYRTLDPKINLAGVILNRVGSDRHLNLLKEALEPLKIEILGILRRNNDITIPDRHLGLIPTDELDRLEPLRDRLAYLAKTCFDWEKLFSLLRVAPSCFPSVVSHPFSLTSPVKIAIARDKAFNFLLSGQFRHSPTTRRSIDSLESSKRRTTAKRHRRPLLWWRFSRSFCRRISSKSFGTRCGASSYSIGNADLCRVRRINVPVRNISRFHPTTLADGRKLANSSSYGRTSDARISSGKRFGR